MCNCNCRYTAFYWTVYFIIDMFIVGLQQLCCICLFGCWCCSDSLLIVLKFNQRWTGLADLKFYSAFCFHKDHVYACHPLPVDRLLTSLVMKIFRSRYQTYRPFSRRNHHRLVSSPKDNVTVLISISSASLHFLLPASLWLYVLVRDENKDGCTVIKVYRQG